MQRDLKTIPECDLGYVELNSEKSSSILFLHGAFSSPLELSLVTPHLEEYHILIPALHDNVKGHQPKKPYTTQGICFQLEILIRRKARHQRAHIYGHSMGAHLALNLAIEYPDRVATVIASGITVASRFPWWKRTGLPLFIYLQTIAPRTILSKQRQLQLFNYAMRPASLTLMEEMLSQPLEGDWSTCKEICASIIEFLPMRKPIQIKARTLIVAGTATVGDTVDDVKYVVNEIRKTGGEAMGVEIKHGGHPWILQLPELCADINKAWIDGGELPDGATIVELN